MSGPTVLIFVIALFIAFIGQRYFVFYQEMHARWRDHLTQTRGGAVTEATVRSKAWPHVVRPPLYVLAFLGLAAGGSFLVLSVIGIIAELLGLGPLEREFLVYFSAIGIWLAAAALSMQLYFTRRPSAPDEK